MDPAFVYSLQIESWALYGIAVLIFCLRLFTRIYYNGLRAGIQSDDFVMMFAMVTYTVLIILLNLIVISGGSNLFPPEDFKTFTPENIAERIEGSKMVLISEQAMLVTIWSIKTTLLIFYSRLTMGLHASRVVQAFAYYVAMGFVACELTFFLACRPFTGYWAVPPPDPECTTFVHYATVNAVFNISSDFMMMFIPLPLLIASKLPLKQKIAVCTIFFMGTFVIIAAILTKVFNLSDVYSPEYMKWYIREASTALYVANIPLIWPLIRRVIPGFGTTVSSAARSISRYDNRGETSTNDVEMQSQTTRTAKTSASELKSNGEHAWESDSTERIVCEHTEVEEGVIRREITVTVENEKALGNWEEMGSEEGMMFVGEGAGSAFEYSINIESVRHTASSS